MSIVKFNSPDEFLAELERDRPWIEDGIVRVTQQFTHGGIPHTHRLAVVATAIVRTPTDRRTLVQCSTVQGAFMDGTAEEKQIRSAARKLVERIEQELTKMQCDIRAGIYEKPAHG